MREKHECARRQFAAVALSHVLSLDLHRCEIVFDSVLRSLKWREPLPGKQQKRFVCGRQFDPKLLLYIRNLPFVAPFTPNAAVAENRQQRLSVNIDHAHSRSAKQKGRK